MFLLIGATTVSIAKTMNTETKMESQGLKEADLQPMNVTIFFDVTVKNRASPVPGANIKVEMKVEQEDGSVEWDVKGEGITNNFGKCNNIKIFHPGTFKVVAESELGTLESEEPQGKYEYDITLNYNPLIKSKPAAIPAFTSILAKFFPLLQQLLNL